jgi:hypothetical protein
MTAKKSTSKRPKTVNEVLYHLQPQMGSIVLSLMKNPNKLGAVKPITPELEDALEIALRVQHTIALLEQATRENEPDSEEHIERRTADHQQYLDEAVEIRKKLDARAAIPKNHILEGLVGDIDDSIASLAEARAAILKHNEGLTKDALAVSLPMSVLPIIQAIQLPLPKFDANTKKKKKAKK